MPFLLHQGQRLKTGLPIDIFNSRRLTIVGVGDKTSLILSLTRYENLNCLHGNNPFFGGKTKPVESFAKVVHGSQQAWE